MTSIAFLGSHPLGEACLQRLYDEPEIDIDNVVTYPKGYESWWDGSLYELAQELGLHTITIDQEEMLLDRQFDYIISVYYPNILGPDILDTPKEGALNLHQAELPRYRGSNVFSHSIMNAREDDHWKHGTTMHFMAEEVDAGDIVGRRFAEITEDDTAWTLYEKVRSESITLFEELLPKIISDEVHEMRTPQSEFDGKQYFYSKNSLDREKEIPLKALTNPDREIEMYDKIRALDFPPFEPAHTRLNDRKLYLTKMSYENLFD